MTQQNQADLPEIDSEEFIGEFEEMDLTPLFDQVFMVAISTGPRDKGKYICETICGPFDFYEMVGVVGDVYEREQLHAKAFIPAKQFGVPPQVLNENTTDFIEARYMDIIADGLLDGGVLQTKEYTCKAGFVKDDEPEEEVEAEGDE